MPEREIVNDTYVEKKKTEEKQMINGVQTYKSRNKGGNTKNNIK